MNHPAPSPASGSRAPSGPALSLLYQELVEFAPDGYLVTDPAGIIREANGAAAALLHGRKDFLLGKPLACFVAPEGWSDFYKKMIRLSHGGETVRDWELRLRPVNREEIDVVLSAMPVRDDDESLVGFRWTLRDITALKKIEEAFRDEKYFADILVETAPTAILVVDGDGRTLRANPFASAVCGVRPGELLGQDWPTALVAEEDRPRARAMLEALARGQRAEGLYALVGRDGRRHAVAWTGQRLTCRPTQTTLLLTGQDVTALQEAQRQALQAARLAAIGQTMAGMAHESRNALQRCHSCLAILSWKLQDRPDALDLLTRGQNALDDLVRLLEDVGRYAAPLSLQYAPIDLARVWREVWEELAAVRGERDAQLLEERTTIDLVCEVDRFRLKQVFRNILENALAACPGPSRIRIACHEVDQEGQPALEVRVIDNGPGLSPEQQDRIFDAFYTTKVKGTGLGMAIVKRIIEAHGGRILVANAPVGGAEVRIILPRSHS